MNPLFQTNQIRENLFCEKKFDLDTMWAVMFGMNTPVTNVPRIENSTATEPSTRGGNTNTSGQFNSKPSSNENPASAKRTYISNLLSTVEFCPEAAIILFAMLRRLMNMRASTETATALSATCLLTCEEPVLSKQSLLEQEKSEEFPLTVLKFFFWLYANFANFQAFCMRKDILSAIISTIFPFVSLDSSPNVYIFVYIYNICNVGKCYFVAEKGYNQ